MKKNVIVSLADANYFPLLEELIDSIKRFKQSESVAICVLDANAGIEPQTETVWRQADRYKVPRIVFVNKMDKIGADFFNCVKMVKDRTGALPIPINLPIGSENEFEGLVDLVTMKEWIWDSDDLGASWKLVDIRESLKTKAEEMRSELVELAVEQDDAWMEKYLEGEEPEIGRAHV